MSTAPVPPGRDTRPLPGNALREYLRDPGKRVQPAAGYPADRIDLTEYARGPQEHPTPGWICVESGAGGAYGPGSVVQFAVQDGPGLPRRQRDADDQHACLLPGLLELERRQAVTRAGDYRRHTGGGAVAVAAVLQQDRALRLQRTTAAGRVKPEYREVRSPGRMRVFIDDERAAVRRPGQSAGGILPRRVLPGPDGSGGQIQDVDRTCRWLSGFPAAAVARHRGVGHLRSVRRDREVGEHSLDGPARRRDAADPPRTGDRDPVERGDRRRGAAAWVAADEEGAVVRGGGDVVSPPHVGGGDRSRGGDRAASGAPHLDLQDVRASRRIRRGHVELWPWRLSRSRGRALPSGGAGQVRGGHRRRHHCQD